MANMYTLKYYPMLEDPAYRVITIFSAILFVAIGHVSLFHASQYGTLNSLGGLFVFPAIALLSVFSFSDTIEVDKDGTGVYQRRTFFLFKMSHTFKRADLQIDQKYAQFTLDTSRTYIFNHLKMHKDKGLCTTVGKENQIKTRLIYPAQVAIQKADALNKMLGPQGGFNE